MVMGHLSEAPTNLHPYGSSWSFPFGTMESQFGLKSNVKLRFFFAEVLHSKGCKAKKNDA